MPKVKTATGVKHFPYTPKGKAMAKKAQKMMKEKGMKVKVKKY